MSKKIQLILQVFVTLVLLVFLIKSANPRDVAHTLAQSNILDLFIALLLMTLSTVLATWRWFLIMKSLEFKGSFLFYLRTYFKGTFFDQLLPASLGADAVRVFDVASLGYRKRDSLLVILVDRGLGLVALFIINIFANFICGAFLPKPVLDTLNIACAIGIIGFVVAIFIFKIIPPKKFKIFTLVHDLSAYLNGAMNSAKKASIQIVVSVIVHLLTFVAMVFIALAFGVNVSFATFCVIMPPILVLTMIPVSLAGWGIREGAMVGFLGFAGIAKSASISISIMFGFLNIMTGVIGVIIWMKLRQNSAVNEAKWALEKSEAAQKSSRHED